MYVRITVEVWHEKENVGKAHSTVNIADAKLNHVVEATNLINFIKRRNDGKLPYCPIMQFPEYNGRDSITIAALYLTSQAYESLSKKP